MQRTLAAATLYCDFFAGSALGAALLPPLEDVSLEDDELGVEGVALDEELELGLEGADGVALEELEEPDGEDGELLEPDAEPDMEPDGEDGVVLLEDDEPVGDLSRAAPGPVLAFLSQPYRLVTATAIGSTTNAVFLSKLIW